MESTTILKGYTDQEKGAYLGAIASLATADQSASAEEISYISEVADAADISPQQKEMVLRAAKEITPEELKKCLDILRNSELRFSLIAELISFAKADGQYGEEEKSNIEEVAKELGINNRQFSLLDTFVTKAAESPEAAEPVASHGFLDSLGLNDRFKSEGMNMSGMGKGLLAIAAPLLLGNLFRRRITGRPSGFGGLGAGGGLGSLLGGLSMSRGFGNTGGLLGRLFGGRRI